MNATTTPLDQALNSISEKRAALEKLIRVACGVESQHAAFNEMALAVRPSQDFPPKLIKMFAAMDARLAESDSTALLQKLETVEQTIEHSIEKMLLLAKLDVESLRNNQVDSLDLDAFQTLIDQFKRQTHTSLALRAILKKRGMAIAPLHLPIPQESIHQEILALKEKERVCVKQIRVEIQTIIRDSQSILKQPSLPDSVYTELQQVIAAMQANITHLDAGGTVSQIPNPFEIVTLASDLPTPTVEPATNEPPVSPTATAKTPDATTPSSTPLPSPLPMQRKSYWWLLQRWLSSPWSTSWRTLKQKYRPNPPQ